MVLVFSTLSLVLSCHWLGQAPSVEVASNVLPWLHIRLLSGVVYFFHTRKPTEPSSTPPICAQTSTHSALTIPSQPLSPTHAPFSLLFFARNSVPGRAGQERGEVEATPEKNRQKGQNDGSYGWLHECWTAAIRQRGQLFSFPAPLSVALLSVFCSPQFYRTLLYRWPLCSTSGLAPLPKCHRRFFVAAFSSFHCQ